MVTRCDRRSSKRAPFLIDRIILDQQDTESTGLAAPPGRRNRPRQTKAIQLDAPCLQPAPGIPRSAPGRRVRWASTPTSRATGRHGAGFGRQHDDQASPCTPIFKPRQANRQVRPCRHRQQCSRMENPPPGLSSIAATCRRPISRQGGLPPSRSNRLRPDNEPATQVVVDDQPAAQQMHLHRADAWPTASTPKRPVKEKTPPARLAPARSAPINSTRRALIASPSPVPPNRRVVDTSAWKKASEIAACCLSAGNPIPVSRIEKRRKPNVGALIDLDL